MRILVELPPFLNQIRAAGMNPDVMKTVFTYGDIIYNPGNNFIPDHLLVHEGVHMRQQGDEPDVWIEKYLVDVNFRLRAEVEAYHAQYQFFCKHNKDRNQCFKFLREIAGFLASPMYGNLVNLNQAMELIKNG